MIYPANISYISLHTFTGTSHESPVEMKNEVKSHIDVTLLAPIRSVGDHLLVKGQSPVFCVQTELQKPSRLKGTRQDEMN